MRTNYTAFGLKQAGICDMAAGELQNNRLYNKGSELQHDEFSDGSGLELYDTHYRQLDPQTGRWNQIDPKCDAAINPDAPENDDVQNEADVDGLESLSPYTSMGNDPIKHNDPNGDEPGGCCVVAEGILNTTAQIQSAIIENTGGPDDVAADVVAGAVDVVGGLAAGLSALIELAHPPSVAPPAPANIAPPKAVIATPKPTAQTQNIVKKEPKDLVQEAKDQKAKEQAKANNAATRAAQTARGNTRTGNSNNLIKGQHTKTSGGKKGDKDSNGNARRAKDQGVKGPNDTN